MDGSCWIGVYRVKVLIKIHNFVMTKTQQKWSKSSQACLFRKIVNGQFLVDIFMKRKWLSILIQQKLGRKLP